jgi:antitoxin YefM
LTVARMARQAGVMMAAPWTADDDSWHADPVRAEPFDDAVSHLADLADEVEATHGRVKLTREGHSDLVLLSADDLASLEETVLWQRDEAERAAAGEPPGDGEEGPGLSEAEVRARFGHLLDRDTA